MKPYSHDPGFRGAVAATVAAAFVLVNGPLVAAAPPAAVLAPEQIAKLLEEGAGVLKQGNPDVALTKYFEPVNQSFIRQTANVTEDEEIYASHGPAETAVYAARVAKNNETAKKPVRMVTIDGAWTDALVLKAQALVELKRISEAESALNMATVISPTYPTPWNGLGSIYQSQKDWEKSRKTFWSAENVAGAVVEKTLQTQVLATSLRGQAFALAELGKLDESAALYKRCLKLDPADSAATDGLARIDARRAAEAGNAPAPTPAPATAAPPTPPR